MNASQGFKSILLLLSIIIIMCPFNGALAAQHYADPSKPIFVSRRQSRFTIRLPANRTTGYAWYLVEYNSVLIKPLKYRYKKLDTKRIGSGGYAIWTFTGLSNFLKVPQMTLVKLVYAQPWNWQQGKQVTLQIFSQR